MGASTPLWVPLTIAVVGLTTTLGAAVLTQWWASRREDVRWGRERDDRQQQWLREDSLRWQQDRQQAYARFVAVLFEWDDHLSKARTARKMDMQYNMRTKLDWSEVDRLRRAAHDELALVQFMAPRSVSEAAGSAVTYREAFRVVYLEPEAIHIKELDEGWSRVHKSRSVLLAAVRENLGLEIGPEDTES
jgi:hypothetical protein